MANVTAHMPIIKIFVPSSPNKRANASLAEATILPLSQPILTMHNKSNNKKTHDISQANFQNPTFGWMGITTNGKGFAVHLYSFTHETT